MAKRLKITATLIEKGKEAKAETKPFDIYDTDQPGFILRVQPSGVRSYNAEWGNGRRSRGGGRVSLGKVGDVTAEGPLTPDRARAMCLQALGNVAAGRHPLHGIYGAAGLGAASGPSLGEFITTTYEPSLRADSPRNAQEILNRLRLHFGAASAPEQSVKGTYTPRAWYVRPIASITSEELKAWRLERLTAIGPKGKPVKPATAQRDLDDLAGVFTAAMDAELLTEHPVRKLKKQLGRKIKADSTPRVRYLDSAGEGEEQRMREALAARDREMIEARESANRWRTERGYNVYPVRPHYGDHLTPAVLLSMNTGLRHGELVGLTWGDVYLSGANPHITVQGEEEEDHDGTKTRQTRHIPLNAEAIAALRHWQQQALEPGRIFPFGNINRTAFKALLKRASITKFRWNDLRHHFASRLVQRGVPLNTVRELMGHKSLTMVLRYAHLAPDQRTAAVALLCAPTQEPYQPDGYVPTDAPSSMHASVKEDHEG